MGLGGHLIEVQRLTLGEVRQPVPLLVLDRVVLVPLHAVGAEEAVEALDLPGDTEHHLAVAVLPRHVGRDAVEDRGRHLRGDRPGPDELVQARLLGRQMPADELGRAQHGGRPDGLVRLLSALRRVGRAPRAVERVAVAVLGAHEAGDLTDRLVGEVERVGTHVGDEPDLLAATQRDALVQLLRDGHRLPRAEPDARRLALQRRGLERRLRVALLLRPAHLGDGVGERRGAGDDRVGLVLRPHDPQRGLRGVVLALEVLRPRDAQPVHPHEAGPDVALTTLTSEQAGHVEVGLRHERADLVLAVDDQPQRDRLDAPRGDARGDGAPQDRRQAVPDDAVDGPARLLRLDERHVEVSRVGERGPDGGFGDLVEGDPVGRRDVEAEHLREVPGDRLALAVEVRGEPDGLRRPRGLAQRGDVLGGPLRDLVDEAAATAGLVELDGEVRARQVPDVPVRGQHGVARTEVPLDRPGLRRGLDDDEVLRAHALGLHREEMRGRSTQRGKVDASRDPCQTSLTAARASRACAAAPPAARAVAGVPLRGTPRQRRAGREPVDNQQRKRARSARRGRRPTR